jgi:hypothetical protein
MFHVIMRVLINSGLEADGDVTAVGEIVGAGTDGEEEREGGKSACSRAITPGWLRLALEGLTACSGLASVLDTLRLNRDESRCAVEACVDWEAMAHRLQARCRAK